MALIDGTDLILGRLATAVAERLLLGEKIDIVNCENVVISGAKKRLLDDFKHKIKRGIPSKGPHFPKYPHMIVKRTVRGMLPHKQAKGVVVFKNLKCHVGVPSELKDKKTETIQNANVNKLPNFKFMKLKDISFQLGAKFD